MSPLPDRLWNISFWACVHEYVEIVHRQFLKNVLVISSINKPYWLLTKIHVLHVPVGLPQLIMIRHCLKEIMHMHYFCIQTFMTICLLVNDSVWNKQFYKEISSLAWQFLLHMQPWLQVLNVTYTCTKTQLMCVQCCMEGTTTWHRCVLIKTAGCGIRMLDVRNCTMFTRFALYNNNQRKRGYWGNTFLIQQVYDSITSCPCLN